jgi:glycosyltransferase involved in cell wall biosynthesis
VAVQDQRPLVAHVRQSRTARKLRSVRVAARKRMRPVLVGEGPSRPQIAQLLGNAGMASLTWGSVQRANAPEVTPGLYEFILPSRLEGISNTILGAIATALPIVAMAVGRNSEISDDGVTRCLVLAGDVETLTRATLGDLHGPARARQRSATERHFAPRRFRLKNIVAAYRDQHQRLLTCASLRCAPQRA